jgi:glutathione S-transferase
MLKLYYWPATCSIAIRILLEEIGAPYEDERIDLGAKQQHSAGFLQINAKAKVPALLRDDGSLLTEVPAISTWLALTYPAARMLASDVETRVRTFEIMEYISGTIHMNGAARAWRPASFSDNEASHDAIRTRGKDIVMRGLGVMSEALGEKHWLLDDYSIADPFLFFIEYWAKEKVGYDMPTRIERHYRRMLTRPAVQRALKCEGLTLP